jgi:uncharacterized protein YbjT (DUF2867 family)
MRLILVGATGLVGRHVLALSLSDPRIEPSSLPSVVTCQPILSFWRLRSSFEQLPEAAEWWQADAVVCALGTTMRVAGSKDAFRRVDYDYPLSIARLARQHGTPTFVLNSAMGADPSSRFFYNQVKGEVERDLAAMGFRSLTLVRPGLIGGIREEVRPGERAAAFVLGLLHPILPRRLRINPAGTIARAMLEAAIAAPQASISSRQASSRETLHRSDPAKRRYMRAFSDLRITTLRAADRELPGWAAPEPRWSSALQPAGSPRVPHATRSCRSPAR